MTREQELALLYLIELGDDECPSPEVRNRFFGGLPLRDWSLPSMIQATASQDGLGFEVALAAAFRVGPVLEMVPTLKLAFPQTFHKCHEDVISLLDDLRLAGNLDTFILATRWIPDYLEWDDTRALAVKAIYAIGNLPGRRAAGALREIVSRGESPLVEEAAARLIEREGGGLV